MKLNTEWGGSQQSQLHQLFFIVLMTCCLGERLKLWVTKKNSMSGTILWRIQMYTSVEIVTSNDAIYNEVLKEANFVFKFGLPQHE